MRSMNLPVPAAVVVIVQLLVVDLVFGMAVTASLVAPKTPLSDSPNCNGCWSGGDNFGLNSPFQTELEDSPPCSSCRCPASDDACPCPACRGAMTSPAKRFASYFPFQPEQNSPMQTGMSGNAYFQQPSQSVFGSYPSQQNYYPTHEGPATNSFEQQEQQYYSRPTQYKQNNFGYENRGYAPYNTSPLGYSYTGYINRQARRYPIMMYTLVQCVPCQRAKHLLAVSYADVAAHFLELIGDESWQRQLQVDLHKLTGQITFPYIFICGQHIGGSTDLFNLHQSGQLRTMLNNCVPRNN